MDKIYNICVVVLAHFNVDIVTLLHYTSDVKIRPSYLNHKLAAQQRRARFQIQICPV